MGDLDALLEEAEQRRTAVVDAVQSGDHAAAKQREHDLADWYLVHGPRLLRIARAVIDERAAEQEEREAQEMDCNEDGDTCRRCARLSAAVRRLAASRAALDEEKKGGDR